MNKKPLLAIFIIVFIDILSFTLILPYLPLFAERFGATPTQVGLLITAFAVCQFLAGPTLGRLSDVYGRKPILAISQAGTCLGFILLALANSLPLVFLARIIDGITAGNITVAQATISDVTEPKDRTKAFGLIGVSFGLGFFIGPAISSFLVRYGFSAPAWAAAGLSFCSVFSTLWLLPVKATENKPRFSPREFLKIFDFKIIAHYLKMPQSRSSLLKFFFFNFSFTCMFAGFAMFAERRFTLNDKPIGATELGYLYAYLGLLGIFVQTVLLAKSLKFFGEKKTGIIGFALQGIGYSMYAFSYKIPVLLFSVTLGSSGSNLTRASITSQISKSATPQEQGTILGVGQSLASIAGIFAPVISGLLIDKVSLEAWALCAGLSALIGLFV